MSKDSSKGSSRKVTDSELLMILREAESPVLKTKEIAEKDDVPIGARQVENRLKSLENQDHVGSRIIIANPEAKVWWDKKLEVKQEWVSNDKFTDEIGVEAVDILEDVEGHGETLRKRRESVNTVFRYLFIEEESVASELRLVGWGVDMDTYSSPESLWNNCLKVALKESNFFQRDKTQGEWQLSQLGLWLKNRDERGLWNNWRTHKAVINSTYHQDFHYEITSINDIEELDTQTSKTTFKYDDFPIDLEYLFATVLTIDREAWACDEGTLSFITELRGDKDQLREIYNKRERKSLDANFDVIWEDHIESHSTISVRRYRDIQLDASKLFKDVSPDGSGQRLANIERWVDETRDGMIEIFSTE